MDVRSNLDVEDSPVLAAKNTEESLLIRSLVISWGCYLGGVETALFHRLTALNTRGYPTHAYFYHKGQGLNNFSSIPHKVSKAPGHLVRYIDEHRFHVITFINTLHNFDVLKSMEYSGKVLFEFHGKTEGIVNSLRFINELKDGGMIQGIVVPSRYVAEIAYENLRNRPDLSVFVARNTLDTTLFSARSVGDFLDKYHIPIRWMTNPIIGWVGRIEPNKSACSCFS